MRSGKAKVLLIFLKNREVPNPVERKYVLLVILFRLLMPRK